MDSVTGHSFLIKTPEGVVFSQTLAGPVTRCLAWAVDCGCILVITMVLAILPAMLRIISAGVAQAVSILIYFVVSMGYGMLLEWHWRGQTLGKRILRLRVVDAQGLRLQFSQVAIRNLLRFVDILPGLYLLGGVVCLFNSRSQRLGDLAANTIVIRIPAISEPELEKLFGDKFNSLHAYPHLEARLRQRTSPAEAGLALDAIMRRERFEPIARVELFAELADHFRSKVQFPSEATEGMTDEQFVRNVVDVIYRSRTAARPQSLKPGHV